MYFNKGIIIVLNILEEASMVNNFEEVEGVH